MNPKYTIAMCNYNMERTLEQSLTSILGQLDDRFEVLVVDDGSSDNSVEVIRGLQSKYNNLRLLELKRDKKRKLGLTRNISVQESKGEYIMLHLDCDDIYAPYLCDFVNVFHQVEKAMGYAILLSGQHINMARKDFLLKHGPYKNIFRGEDRNLWVRLAAENAYIPLDHVDFATRLPKTTQERNSRAIRYTWDHVVNDFRSGATLRSFLYYEFNRDRGFSWKVQIIRLLFSLPAWFFAKFEEPLTSPPEMDVPEKFAAYRNNIKGSFRDIMERNKEKVDISEMSEEVQKIFLL